MKRVNVVQRVRRKPNQQHRRAYRADSHRARHEQQHRRHDLRSDDRDRRGPQPALVIKSGRAQQLTHVLRERVDDRELRNRGEQKQRRQSKARYAKDPLLHALNPRLSCQRNHFLRCILHSIRNREVQTRLTNDALTLFNVCSFEPHNDRNLNPEIACRFNHTTRHHVAAHDAAEDIDQHCPDILIRKQNSKCSFNSFLRRAAANVEKVSRLPTREFDDVHRCHRESGAVHHARDVAVELDVVEIKFGRFDLERLFFVEVAQIEKLLVTKERVVVKVDLRVECDETAVFRQQKRIDLGERCVHLFVRGVKRLHELHRLTHERSRQAETESKFACLKRLKTDTRINRLFENFFRRGSSDFFDVHSACRRSHEHLAPTRAIEHDAEIELFINRQPFLDQQHAHFSSFRTRLMSDEFHAQHLPRNLARFVSTARQLDATAFTAAARVYLRFHHHDLTAEFFRRLISLFGRACHNCTRHWNTVLSQQFFTLVLMNLHATASDNLNLWNARV